MLVETTRFGSVEVRQEDIIKFPEGMLGFSKIHEYILVERSDDSLILWLQALKKPSVAFPLLEPEIFEVNYGIELQEEDRKILALDEVKHAKVFAIITIPGDPSKMTANLKAPLVINVKKRSARQVILHNVDYPIRKSVFADIQRYCATQQRTLFPDSEGSSYQTVSISEQMTQPPAMK